jgi:hypothetical protein
MCDCRDFSPHIDPSESEIVRHSCSSHGRMNTITCQDAGKEIFLEEVDGLDLGTVNLTTPSAPLPYDYIPIIPRGMFRRSAEEIPYSVVGVMINDILTKPIKAKDGYYYVPIGTKIRLDLLDNPVFKGKRVILFSAGQDILIETIWWERHALDFFKIISDMGFLAVTGMNFSIISGECPFGHALNMKKSLCYCQGLDGLGVWSIPHIYAINQHQRERWKDWLNSHPDVKVVTINTQLQRNQKVGMGDSFETICFLLKETDVKVIIHGRGKGLPKDIRRQYADRLHYAASGPQKSALIRRDKSVKEYINIFLLGLEIPVLQDGAL